MQTVLTIAYDGTDYAGWQRQVNGVAVQQRVEEALAAVMERSVTVRAASRTDAGVHALGQRAVFGWSELKIPLGKLPNVLNGLLPRDISVTDAVNVPDGFNPRHADRKTYRYQFNNAPFPNPLVNRYSAFVPQKLNITLMQEAARHIVGRHDFSAFKATGGSEKTTEREVYECELTGECRGLLTLTVTGNAFLYNMVRIIAGTVLYAGLGKIAPDDIPGIIASRNRTRAGKTMPPEGLTLMRVEYDALGSANYKNGENEKRNV
jgi:tRNA pseudouridine38-40 synthase